MPARTKQRDPIALAKLPPVAKQLSIRKVFYGSREIAPWYPSSYHEDLIGKHELEVLYVCSTCFKYTTDLAIHAAHSTGFCIYEGTPPGVRCYSNLGYEIYEVDGEEDRLFAQNLSLFGKLFIENKSVCFDVGGFMYYILVVWGQIVGYFSKEKLSWDNNNLACILVFPPFQNRGCGKKLMAASYFLSKHEGTPGGPERPLSEPGRRSYEAYWSRAIAACILDVEGSEPITILDISENTCIVAEDVASTLSQMGLLNVKIKSHYTISKKAVREWIKRTHTSMDPPLDVASFYIVHGVDTTDEEDASITDMGSTSEDPDEEMSGA